MAPLALAPGLLIPFAKAVGLTTALLSLQEISDLVADYMEDNPEKSEMILGMLNPAEGILSGGFNALFNKKSKGGEEEISLEEIETKPKSKRSKKEIVLEALRKEKGNYASPDAEGNYASKRGRIIRGLADEGKITDKPDSNYDPSKKYQGYKKFFNKADGGMAGTKTYHQYHDQYVPMDSESMMYANGGGVGSMMQPRQNYALAGFIEDESETFTPNNFGLQLNNDNVDNTQVAEAFNTQSQLKNLGAIKPGKVFGYNLTEPGEALEDFRNSAVNFYNSPNNSAKTAQSAYDFMMGTNPNMFKDVKENKSFIQDAINKGFLGTEQDYENQKSIANPDDLEASLTNQYGYPLTADLSGKVYNQVSANNNVGNYITRKDNYVSPTMDMKMNQSYKASPKEGIFKSLINNAMDSKPMRGLTSAYNLASDNVIGPLFAGVAGIANRYNPLREGSQNYNKDLKGQVDMLNERGMLGDQSSPYKITAGPLAGKNLVSGFGTNDYGQMLQKRIDYFRGFKNLTDSQYAKLHATIAAKKAADAAAAKNQTRQQSAIERERGTKGSSDYGNPGGTSGAMTSANQGTYCFDPSTPIQMADGSTKEIKNIQLGDSTKGGEVTGVFQFKASDEIHDYKGVTVAGSHYVKEDGRFIMVKDSPLSVKIDKIPVVYSLDTTGRRIFINDIEFSDYNGDGVAKNFLSNAGVDLSGFNKEVLRQVENRLI